MKVWRIKKVKQPNGDIWFIPQYRKWLFFWHSITAIEHMQHVYLPFSAEACECEYRYALTEAFHGYTYFLTEADAMRTAQIYDRGRVGVVEFHDNGMTDY